MGGFVSWLRVQWDRAGAVAAGLVGLGVLLLGWAGVSNTPHIAEQLPYFISGGLVGLFFLGLGVALWLSADLRDEWRELRALRLMLTDGQAVPSVQTGPSDQASASAPTLETSAP